MRAAARAELADVTVARGGRDVLHRVTLAVPAEGVTALVGPSGAGKSSLLRCLVRLDEPRAGRILVDGSDVRTQDPCALRRRLGLVAQAPAMLPGSVRENLAYGLPAPATEDELVVALGRAGLPVAFLERDARGLSGGEAMRVAIARALTRGPEALLLDEPTAALDDATAAGVADQLAAVAAEGVTVLIVSHDEALARRLASWAARLRDGRLEASGPASSVLGS